jgi:hypothetical protein
VAKAEREKSETRKAQLEEERKPRQDQEEKEKVEMISQLKREAEEAEERQKSRTVGHQYTGKSARTSKGSSRSWKT